MLVILAGSITARFLNLDQTESREEFIIIAVFSKVSLYRRIEL